MKKHIQKAKRRKEPKRLLLRLATAAKKLWSLLALVGLVALFLIWNYAGAEDLRTKVYQPLYSEVASFENFLEAMNQTAPFSTDTRHALKTKGEWHRLPQSLQREIDQVYEQASEMFGALTSLSPRLQRLMSAKIMNLRTSESDAQWTRKAVEQLRQAERNEQGISPARSFVMKHTGRTPVFDARDPKNPIIVFPGGPTWQIKDWLEYPDTVGLVDEEWGESDFLFFDDLHGEFSYYRITRSDLHTRNLTLSEFLSEAYRTISEDADYQKLKARRVGTLMAVRALKNKLGERIRDPKHLSDLID